MSLSHDQNVVCAIFVKNYLKKKKKKKTSLIAFGLGMSRWDMGLTKFGLNVFIHISIYSNIQIYILQYNHDGIQKKSHATYLVYESVSL